MIHLADLLASTSSEVASMGSSRFSAVSINSSEMPQDGLFFAIRGNRDGHDFVLDAVRAGAAGVVVERDVEDIPKGVTVIKVPDTLKALQDYGAAIRQTSSAQVVAVTGSVGKTTTKSMVAHVLESRFDVLSSAKSYNNHLGVPLSLSRLEAHHTHAVAEVGTNHRGEISRLAQLVSPDVALVTNVGFAHLGNFESREELADEKTDLLRHVKSGGFLVINGDDQLLCDAADRQEVAAGVKTVRVGLGAGNDIRATELRYDERGTTGTISTDGESVAFRIDLAGRHFVYAMLFALATGRIFGISLQDSVTAVADFVPPQGRASMKQVTEDLTVLDDSYNASPDATLAALDLLGEMTADTRVAVLGEMRELGSWSDELHKLVGEKAAASATHLIAVGDGGRKLISAAEEQGLEFSQSAMSARDAYLMTQEIVANAPGRCVVLAKGARFMHMERVPLGLSGTNVRCSLELCTKYIHCQDCALLEKA
ncbi:UDP-N-acetylmuramoyl-tripeptide--D-alanyl-D-alanine ligase [Streptomyces sp. NEAU-174]|uniref:UDP-N-acetylmuramoyl-tripeptide--D-alanyl-D- alanine ligase n=1 Tax=Streptomyces sp. NEAU-174 TaxID=3458254 RepID=UPI0040441A36